MSKGFEKKLIKVEAIRMGYRKGFGRIKPGTVFYIDSEKEFSENWMKLYEGLEAPKEPAKPKRKFRREVAEDVEPKAISEIDVL